jgi:TRAP-type C4-dicarboxylate transport system substrate-binding protein
MAAKVRNALGSAALLGLLLSGCSSDSAGTKAGGEGPPLTLRLGTDDEPGRRAADQIADFARRVDELSDGRVSIRSGLSTLHSFSPPTR